MTHHSPERDRTAGTTDHATQLETAPDHAQQLAAECHGDPARLAILLAKLPAPTKRTVLIAAQRLYGNAFVQRAVSADPGGPGGQHESHATPHPPKSTSHVTPGSHLPSAHGQHESHATPRSHGHESHATPHPTQIPSIGDVTFEKTQSLHYYEGTTVVSESVTLAIKAGEGPVHFAASDGALTVGDEHFHLSLKDGKAITGHLTIPGVTIGKLGSWKSKLKVQGGYLGVELGALYGLKGNGWEGSMSVSAFVGFAPTDKFPPDSDPLKIPAPSLQQVIEACELGLLAGIAVGIATGLIVLA